MFKLSDLIRVYREEAGEADKAGAGNAPKTFTQEEVDALVSGLKSNNDKLLAEKKEAKRLADEAAAARLQTEQEAAKRSGELETFEKTLRSQYDPQLEAKDKIIASRNERILTSEKKAVVSSLAGMLIDESATDILGMMVRTEFDGDDVVVKFVGPDGAVITTDEAQFKKYLCEHKAFSHLIKADAATGGGANGSKKPNGGADGGKLTGIDKTRADIKQRLAAKFK